MVSYMPRCVDDHAVVMRMREMAQETASLEALNPEPAPRLAHRADLPGSDLADG